MRVWPRTTVGGLSWEGRDRSVDAVRAARHVARFASPRGGQLAQAGQEATFHADHVHPLAEDGPTTLENLALACVSCSLRKGARLLGRDPESGEEVRLYHPRRCTPRRWGSCRAIRGHRVVMRTIPAPPVMNNDRSGPRNRLLPASYSSPPRSA